MRKDCSGACKTQRREAARYARGTGKEAVGKADECHMRARRAQCIAATQKAGLAAHGPGRLLIAEQVILALADKSVASELAAKDEPRFVTRE